MVKIAHSFVLIASVAAEDGEAMLQVGRMVNHAPALAEEDIDISNLLQIGNVKKVNKTLLETENVRFDWDTRWDWSRPQSGDVCKNHYKEHKCTNAGGHIKGARCNIKGVTDTWCKWKNAGWWKGPKGNDCKCGSLPGRCHQQNLDQALKICCQWANCKGVTQDNAGFEPRGMGGDHDVWSQTQGYSEHVAAHAMFRKKYVGPSRRTLDNRGVALTMGYNWPRPGRAGNLRCGHRRRTVDNRGKDWSQGRKDGQDGIVSSDYFPNSRLNCDKWN